MFARDGSPRGAPMTTSRALDLEPSAGAGERALQHDTDNLNELAVVAFDEIGIFCVDRRRGSGGRRRPAPCRSVRLQAAAWP